MPFDSQKRYLAFSASTLANVDHLRETYGENANISPNKPSGEKNTLLCYIDRDGSDDMRAATLGETARPIVLTDGRYCLGGYWVESVIDAFNGGEIEGEELTFEQVKSLIPTEEI